MKHGLKVSIEDTDKNKDFKPIKSPTTTPVNKIQSQSKQSKKSLKKLKSQKSVPLTMLSSVDSNLHIIIIFSK